MKPEAGHRVAAHGTRTHSKGPTVEGASSLALVEGVVGLLPHWGMGGLSAVADAGTKDGMAWQDVLEMEMEMDFWGWIDRCLPPVYAMCIGFSRWLLTGSGILRMDAMGGLHMHQLSGSFVI